MCPTYILRNTYLTTKKFLNATNLSLFLGSIAIYEGWHFGGGELHSPSLHCKYEFPIVVKPLLHVNMATSGENINTLPLSGLLSFGHTLISIKQKWLFKR